MGEKDTVFSCSWKWENRFGLSSWIIFSVSLGFSSKANVEKNRFTLEGRSLSSQQIDILFSSVQHLSLNMQMIL